MANWKEMINEKAGDDEIIACTLTEYELRREFDAGPGRHKGECFTAWGEKYVYFPVVYDGAEWVGKAPRNPCKESTKHIGSEAGL